MSGLHPITVNTPPEEEAHIYAEDDAAIYQSILGGDGVCNIGQTCAATVLSNNKVRVADGVINVDGHIARVRYGEYQDCEIMNGQTGYNRNDLIVAKFATTGSKGIDTYTIEVIQGTTSTEEATDPELAQGSLYEGEKTRMLPLYRVKIEGLSIVAVEQMFELIPTIADLKKEDTQLNNKIIALETKTYNVTLEKNSYVSPYTNFGFFDITSESKLYGRPFSVYASTTGGVPVPVYISDNDIGTYQVKVVSMHTTASVSVTYCK